MALFQPLSLKVERGTEPAFAFRTRYQGASHYAV